MNGYGGATSALGMGQTLLNVASSQAIKPRNREIRRIQEGMRQRGQDFSQNEMSMGQQDVNRQADQMAKNTEAADIHNTGASSSIRPMNQKLIEGERSRRYDTIQRRREFDRSNFSDESQIIRVKKQIQGMQDTMNLINSALDGGANGAAQNYSERQY